MPWKIQTFGIYTSEKARKALLSPQLLYSMEYPNQLPNFAQITMLASYMVMWVWQTKICSTGISMRRVKNTAGDFQGLKHSACAGLSLLPCEHTLQGLPCSSLGVTRGWLCSCIQTCRCFLLSQNHLLVLFRIYCISILFSLYCPKLPLFTTRTEWCFTASLPMPIHRYLAALRGREL